MVFTQRNFVVDFLHVKCDLTQKNSCFVFSSPPLGSLGARYYVHLRFIGKHIVDFLLVVTELLLLGATAEAL